MKLPVAIVGKHGINLTIINKMIFKGPNSQWMFIGTFLILKGGIINMIELYILFVNTFAKLF